VVDRLTSTVRKTLADWSTRARSGWSGEVGWEGIVAGSGTVTTAGVSVTPESALTLVAAFACVNVVATDFAMLPTKVYRRRKSGGRDEVRDTSLADVLSVSPDGETTSMRSRQAQMGHVLGWGNGYYEIETSGRGEVIGLHLLDPRTTAKRRPQDKKLYYEIPGGKTLPPSRVFHLAGLGFDGLIGYSPVHQAREALGLGRGLEEFGASFIGKGARPSGVLETPRVLKEEAIANLRAGFETRHMGSRNAGRVVLLEQGVTYKPISISPEDAQYLDSRRFQLLEVCRIYRVPPHKVGDFGEAHLNNIEAANIDYATTVQAPWCEQWEQMANLRLLTRDERSQGYYIEHSMTALLRGDMKARAEFYRAMETLGALSPNEIREHENLNPIGEQGDVYLAPLNMGPLDLIAEGASLKPAASAPPAEPPDPADPAEPEDPADSADPESDSTPDPLPTPARNGVYSHGRA
jgi:HK97 family phage portal protein